MQRAEPINTLAPQGSGANPTRTPHAKTGGSPQPDPVDVKIRIVPTRACDLLRLESRLRNLSCQFAESLFAPCSAPLAPAKIMSNEAGQISR